ncbi:WD40 repeat-like protein [Armillaria mellea]|nr:WD40 repeat-like protein [Armillaria mellea]
MRARHTAHNFQAFPVYSSAFIANNELVLGGGGGASRSGIKNKLRLYHVGEDRSVDILDEFELDAGEDAPMSMATNVQSHTLVCGANSTEELVAKGQNENCRAFAIKDHKLNFLRKKQTLESDSVEEYQKVTVLSEDGSFVAAAGPNIVHLMSLPSLTLRATPISTAKEIYDVALFGDTMVVVTTAELLVYSIPSKPQKPSPSKNKKKGKLNATTLSELKLQRTVEFPNSLNGVSGGTFRSGRYHPKDGSVFYTAINTSPVRSWKNKSMPRQAFLCKWNTDIWAVDKFRKIGDRALTCFDVSPDGQYLGFGSSDLSIGLLDANTLTPVVSILKAHEFPPTTISFSPDSHLFVSGSADNSVRVVTVPDSSSSSFSWAIIVLILTVLMVLLAAAAQKLL